MRFSIFDTRKLWHSMYYDVHTHSRPLAADHTYIYNVRYAAGIALPCEPHISVGIHPWDADLVEIDEDFVAFAKNAEAIGECGLDKHCQASPEAQLRVFRQQIELANELGKPVIVHCVGRYGLLLELSKEYAFHTPWVLHSCSASAQWIRQSLGENFFYSFSPLNLSSQRGRAAILATPPDKLLLETDESDMKIEEVYEAVKELKIGNR